MPVYEYNALDQRGKNLKGIIEADSESQARAKLRSGGNYPVSLKESKARVGGASQSWFSTSLFNRITPEEVYVITRQLSTLHGAGIPLDTALSSLVEQTRNTALKKVLAQIKGKVSEGKTLAQSMGEHPKLFPHLYINMIRAGEESGSLDVVLEQLADFSEKQQELKGVCGRRCTIRCSWPSSAPPFCSSSSPISFPISPRSSRTWSRPCPCPPCF